jgi:hypothetical protein
MMRSTTTTSQGLISTKLSVTLNKHMKKFPFTIHPYLMKTNIYLLFCIPAALLLSCGEKQANDKKAELDKLKKQQAEITAKIKTLESEIGESTTGAAHVKVVTADEVVSGVFENYSRDGIKETIENHGGKVIATVSGKTSYLVAGAETGPSKMEKATKLGVKVISEKEFTDLCQGTGILENLSE